MTTCRRPRLISSLSSALYRGDSTEHTFHLPPVHQGDDKSWLSRLLPRR